MFITPAYAQSAAPGGVAMIETIIPFLLVFVILYFFLIRPQQKRAKQHRDMIGALRRGDTVVTAGGLIGKVVRVEDQEAQVEVADGVRVRVVRSTIADVRSKTEPAPTEDQKPTKTGAA